MHARGQQAYGYCEHALLPSTNTQSLHTSNYCTIPAHIFQVILLLIYNALKYRGPAFSTECTYLFGYFQMHFHTQEEM